ncbi:hypothetical protein ACDW_20120 [Acidovorax sp. DW039]|uniref:hypothetical protein n=1 Tax=Acidovorax sp. DW039 TaxID=3095606 RepID=UPI00308C19E2|nr:hypothetical protein ACDW_20120 [Acidovorax sp. DW039]
MKLRWNFLFILGSFLLIALVLSNAVPKLENIVGHIFFVFVVLYFALMVPVLLFAKKEDSSDMVALGISPWVKTMICNVWIFICVRLVL